MSKELARLMAKEGISQSGLSRATGVPQPTINRILSRVTQDPRRDSMAVGAHANRQLPGTGTKSPTRHETKDTTDNKNQGGETHHQRNTGHKQKLKQQKEPPRII